MIEKATLTRAGAIVNPRSEPIKGQGPCCPARGHEGPTRWWLCDTGCPYDLTNRSTLPSGTGETHRRKVTLESANGIIECSQAAQLHIEALGENIEPYMLEDSLDVLTVGRRCQKHGWGFHWEPYSDTPYYCSPTGEKVELVRIDYCPYLADTWNAENAPEAASAPSMAGKVAKTGDGNMTKAADAKAAAAES